MVYHGAYNPDGCRLRTGAGAVCIRPLDSLVLLLQMLIEKREMSHSQRTAGGDVVRMRMAAGLRIWGDRGGFGRKTVLDAYNAIGFRDVRMEEGTKPRLHDAEARVAVDPSNIRLRMQP